MEMRQDLHLVARLAAQMVGAAGSCVRLVADEEDVERKRAPVEAVFGLGEEMQKAGGWPLEQATAGEVLNTGTARLVVPPGEGASVPGIEKPLRLLLAVPLVALDRTVGCLSVVDTNASPPPQAEEDLRYLGILGGQAGIALENARLFERLQITERRYRDAQALALRAEKLAALGEMTSRVAHEIRNPLAAIGGFARSIRARMPAGDPQVSKVEVIIQEAERLERFLGDQLHYLHLPEPSFRPVDVNAVLEETLLLLRDDMKKAGMELERQLAEDLPCVPADADQLKQIFLNLIENAIEHAGEGTILRATTRLARAPGAGGTREIEVRLANSGSPVPPETLDRLFVPFFTTKPGGTGLGLPISQEIATRHGGQLRAGMEGRWTVFTLTLPEGETA
jgi:signal transduction histidine kinase